MFRTFLDAAAQLPVLHLPAGAQLIAEDEPLDRLYVLEQGVLAVSRDGVVVARIDQPGAVFGELAALLDTPATATVTAAEDCRLRVSEEPLAFLRSQPEVALAVAGTLARRLDLLTRYLVDVREQYADRADHLGVVDVVLESLSHQQRAPGDLGSDRETEAPY